MLERKIIRFAVSVFLVFASRRGQAVGPNSRPLIAARTGGPQGNPHYANCQLAAQTYGTGAAGCDSSSGNAAASSCIFYNVTQGDIAVSCGGSDKCFNASVTGGGGQSGGPGLNGALTTSQQSYAPAFGAAPGWSFATGIGSVYANNLDTNWPAANGQ